MEGHPGHLHQKHASLPVMVSSGIRYTVSLVQAHCATIGRHCYLEGWKKLQLHR